MRFELMTTGAPLRRIQELARDAAAAGFSGLLVTEGARTAYLACAAAALAADIDISTGIAVAFPRSPMVTAQSAWELAELSGGRFRLGLGTQVRAHVERRYSASFDPPGPRLQEYVEAVRAIFGAFRGDSPLAFSGSHWSFSLLPAQWSPGPIDVRDP
ncbi:MAG: LLM class flavin-dependent oxidoreductase, partial [Acidimicrobiia bacterium]|nr:LLM class flavin-dependent oxidoreductase [Acidimicrobiia bacterium]